MITLTRPLLAVMFVFSFTHAIAATVYRCPQPDGSIAFQQTACSQGEMISVETPASGWNGLRADEQARLKNRPQPRNESSKSANKAGAQTDWQGKGESKTCWGKRQQLEKARTKLRRGYKPAEGERLRRQRDAYEDYLRRFC